MQIITGRTGEPHVTSSDDRAIYQAIFGVDTVILGTDEKMQTEIYSANEIRIKSGTLVTQGCVARINTKTFDSVTINNGTQGMKRIDLIVARYHYESISGNESIEWAVIQGVPDANTPLSPTLENIGEIQNYDNYVDTAVFEIHIDGVAITEVKTLAKQADFIQKQIDGLSIKSILWQGDLQMTANDRIDLPKLISECQSGIVLWFAMDSTGGIYAYNNYFVHKNQVKISTAGGTACPLFHQLFEKVAIKYLYIHDDYITGNVDNSKKGTNNGITYDNSAFKLKAIFEV